MSKIVSLHAENVKRLKAVHIEPNGNLVQIRGRNEQGKTSVLDSIWIALGGAGAFPAVPVREGTEQAVVHLELDDLRITRKISASGRTTLKVEGADGEKFSSPQGLLDKLVAGLSFDPLAFSRLEKRKRLETLQKLVGLDFSALNAERAAKFEERTSCGREARRLEGELTGVPFHEDAPERQISNADLVKEMNAASREHVRAQTLGNDSERACVAARRATERAQSLRAQAAQLIAQAEASESESHEAEALAVRLEAEKEAVMAAAPDMDAIHERIASADAINAKVRDNIRHSELRQKIATQREQYSALSARIDAIDQEKIAQLAAAKYPLPNMSMTEDGVLLNGLPFEQASGAQQLRASVAMGMALSPTLKVLLVRDGSLLDDESLCVMADMAEQWGGQVWIERVASERSGPGILIEDGSVVDADESDEAAE